MKKILLLLLLFSMTSFVSATWTSGLNSELRAYYTFDETTGTNAQEGVFGTYNVTMSNSAVFTSSAAGIINTSADFTPSTYSGTFPVGLADSLEGSSAVSFSSWIKINSTTAGQFFLIAATGDLSTTFMGVDSSGRVQIGGRPDSSEAFQDCTSTAINTGQWYHVVGILNFTDDKIDVYVNGTLNATCSVSWTDTTIQNHGYSITTLARSNYDGYVDEAGLWNRSISASEVSQLYNAGSGITYRNATEPIITLVEPTADEQTINTSITFIANVTKDVNNISNVSLFINGIRNQTNSSGVEGYYYFPVNISTGEYSWSIEAVDNESNVGLSDNRTLSVGNLVVTAESYDTTAIEGASTTFYINVSVINSSALSVATLNYNNTDYAGTITDLGGNLYSISRTVTAPVVSTPTNISFFWNFTLVGVDNHITDAQNQSISELSFSICNATQTAMLNISTYSATNPFDPLTATIKTSWQITPTGGSETINVSYEDITESNKSWAFCIEPSSDNYTVDAIIEVDATGYAKNFHYLTDANLSTDTSNLSLYLLNDSLATLTEFEILDISQNPLSDVYVTVQFYDVGTDTFYTVSMLKTDSNGNDLAYLNWYDSLYKLIFVQDGEVIDTTDPYKISSTPQIFRIDLGSLTSVFDKFEDFQYTLVYNNATGNFVLTYIKPSALVDQACLQVIKRNITNDYTICNTCESSSSATLYCNIDAYGNGTFLASFYATGSLQYITLIDLVKGQQALYSLIGLEDGSAMAIIFAGVITSFFLISPALGIIGVLAGMIGSISLGLQPFDMIAMISITIVGGVLIWLFRR